MFTYSSGIYVL